MISTPHRQTATLLIEDAVTADVQRAKACAELEISDRTLRRWMKDGQIHADQRPLVPRPEPANKLAVLHAKGEMGLDDRLTIVSVIGSTFVGRVVGETTVGNHAAIIPELSGRGWITGIHQHLLDPDDPWPEGYRLSDTWGAK